MMISGPSGNFIVPGSELTVSVEQAFDRKELSGDGSGDDFASGGNKPKTVSVGLILQFEKADDLRALRGLAEALDDSGDPVIYEVTDDTCRAMDVRRVIFIDKFGVSNASGLRAWNVSFSLRDVASTAARREERAEEDAAEKEQAGDGEVKITTPNPQEVAEAMAK